MDSPAGGVNRAESLPESADHLPCVFHGSTDSPKFTMFADIGE